MNDLLKEISNGRDIKLDAVLHLGAGAGRELEHYLRWNAEKVILVEPNAQMAGRLRALVRDVAKVAVIEAAVSANGGEAPLWVVNRAQESSLLQPTLLLKRYQNLNVLRSDIVQTMSLNDLIERLEPNAARNNLLVLEVQGGEISVLSSTAPGGLQKFAWILTRSSPEVMYEGGARLEDVDVLLHGIGFVRTAPVDIVPGLPFQEILYRRDTMQIDLAALKGRLAESDLTIQSLRGSLETQTRLASERQASLEQLGKAKEDLTRQVAEGRQQIEQLTKARDEQTRTAADRQIQLDQVTKARDEQIKLAHAKQVELDRQIGLSRESQTRATQLESYLTEMRTRQAQLYEELAKAEGQIEVIKEFMLREQGS